MVVMVDGGLLFYTDDYRWDIGIFFDLLILNFHNKLYSNHHLNS